MEAVSTSETSVNIYQNTRRDNLEDTYRNNHIQNSILFISQNMLLP
jgi:hypothetical protein